MKTSLVWSTPEAEKLIAYMARVSNPANQHNEQIAGLLKFCITHGHWSIFEMAHMCVEINTTRDISAQILRHRSFSFQEFSQRYAEAVSIGETKPRRQDIKNRQNSIDDLELDILTWWDENMRLLADTAIATYKEALLKGIAKECARRLLPMATSTRLYMCGSIRSWIHYFNLRCDVATQLEHREVASSIREIFTKEFPVIASLLSMEENHK